MAENNNDNFVEKNKTAILQELRGSIGSLHNIISDTLPTALQEEEKVSPPMTATYIELSMMMGYVVGLFNELQTLEFGIEDDSSTPNPIGFAALLDDKE